MATITTARRPGGLASRARWPASLARPGLEACHSPIDGSRPGEIPGIPGWQRENHLWGWAMVVLGNGRLFHPHGAQFGRSLAVNAWESVCLSVQWPRRANSEGWRAHHLSARTRTGTGTVQPRVTKKGPTRHPPIHPSIQGQPAAIPGLGWAGGRDRERGSWPDRARPRPTATTGIAATRRNDGARF